MHFHTIARCERCATFATYTTPLPEVLILSSQCGRCGEFAMRGTTESRRCVRCYELAYGEALRQMRQEADPPAKA